MIQNLTSEMLSDGNGNTAQIKQYLDTNDGFLLPPCLVCEIWVDREFSWDKYFENKYSSLHV